MMKILLLTSDKDSLNVFSTAIAEDANTDLLWAISGNEALSIIKNTKIQLVVADEKLEDMTGLEFIKKLVMINPFVNCMLLSPLSHDDFHEVTEGLGVLMQLPLQPGERDASALLQYLNKIYKN